MRAWKPATPFSPSPTDPSPSGGFARDYREVVTLADDPIARVFWIGGGSAGGKSTVARRLAAEHGLAVYRTDNEMSAHARQLSSAEAPLLHRFLDMDMDERWVSRTPREMLETFPWFHGEGFDRLVHDLRGLATRGPIVAEGFRLLPRLVAPILADRRRAVWLLPTPDFRERVFGDRLRSGRHFVDRTSDPKRALANLADRDHLFTEVVRAEAKALDLTSMVVDGSRGIDDVTADLAQRFGLA